MQTGTTYTGTDLAFWGQKTLYLSISTDIEILIHWDLNSVKLLHGLWLHAIWGVEQTEYIKPELQVVFFSNKFFYQINDPSFLTLLSIQIVTSSVLYNKCDFGQRQYETSYNTSDLVCVWP